MSPFRRNRKNATPARDRNAVLRTKLSQSMVTIAVDEMAVALSLAGIASPGVFRDHDEVDVLFENFEDASTFLSLVFGDDVGLPGSMQDRASEGCLTESSDPENLGPIMLGGQFPWNWDVHPSWSEGQLVWHITATLPLEDALSVIATLNSKSHGDSL